MGRLDTKASTLSTEHPMSRIEMTTPAVPAFAKFAQRISVPFSPVVRAGDWVYVSGLAPVNPETGGYDILTIEQQARRRQENLPSSLAAGRMEPHLAPGAHHERCT